MYGLLTQLSWFWYVAITLVLTHITIIAVTLYLHRSQAHKSVIFNNKINHFFRFWLWLTTGMLTKEWVAVHRKHHVFTEKNGDPHSPQLEGINNVLFRGVELYRIAMDDNEILKKYGEGTPNDWVENEVYTAYGKLGILSMLFINVLLFGLPGIIIWSVQMMWIPFWAAGVINGLCHYFGYRNYACKDASNNIIPFGIIIGGEELHNNHHAHPNSSKFSSSWWEFDLGWFYIKVLSFLGCAKIKNVMPKLCHVPNKESIDEETIHALLSKRFQILTNYTKDVIYPVIKSYSGNITISKRIKSWFLRDQQWLSSSARNQINNLLENCESLKVVCDYRDQLKEIWANTSLSKDELVQSLQSWCSSAELTGITELSEFVTKIRSIKVSHYKLV